MNEKIRNHVAEYNAVKGWDTTEESIIKTIYEAKRIWVGERSDRRWWTDCSAVVDVNGMLIGFDDAETTGDDSPRDKGWEFDPSSICEVEAEEVTTTIYKPIKEVDG